MFYYHDSEWKLILFMYNEIAAKHLPIVMASIRDDSIPKSAAMILLNR